ncbi:ankyrin [Melanomma pulvis-pyrius CBS 109.77]|uniref:Ankyrin n=1 Tax=Melanomma pulvis-pyrius CBS 109.77 TaxID=1314802 RepID=A0A6A6XII7_9PLEO|nr:ankyrin [Melanomma pulvis-pyrius CBS 109.77]
MKYLPEGLLKKGADVNTRDKQGWKPLHEACALANPKILRMLVDAGADSQATIPGRDRPLHITLIHTGADITARGSRHRTPLHMCAESDLAYTAYILLANGLSTKGKDQDTWTPLCCCGDKIAEILVHFGANVNYADKDNWTPLHQTVSCMRRSVVEALLVAGTDVDFRTKDEGLNVMERAKTIPHRETSDVVVGIWKWSDKLCDSRLR